MLRKISRFLITLGVLAAVLVSASPVAADSYDSQYSGHPMRIVAYIAHPVGVILDLLIFRPAHWIGHQGPLQPLFGHEDHEQ